jgi:hypothetical protein
VNKSFRGEGYSSGFYGNDDEVPYGCWFMTARGSGVMVNTGTHWVMMIVMMMMTDDDESDEEEETDIIVCPFSEK